MSIDDQLANAARAHRDRFERASVPDLPAAPRRRGRAVAVVAGVTVVAVVAAVVAVSGVLSTRHSPGAVHVTAPPASATPATGVPRHTVRDADLAATPVLWPTWLPAGEELWSATSQTDGGIGVPSQLFGTVAADGTLAPGALFEFQPGSPGDTVNGTLPPVRVRGVEAAVSPPKDAAGASLEIMWVEGNALVTAIFRGVSQDQAVALLDGLRPHGTSLLAAGFDPASAPAGFADLGERFGADASRGGTEAVFEYAPEPADTPADATGNLRVTTQTRSLYPGYFRALIGGRRGPDGVVVETDAFDVYHLVTLAWPDGHAVTLQSTITDDATLERIGRSVESVDAERAQARLQTQTAHLAALPLSGSATLASAHIELHADGAIQSICVRVADGAPVCRSNVAIQLPGGFVAGSLVIDGRWFIVGVAPTYDPTIGPQVSLGEKPAPNIPAETATIGTGHVALAPVPASVDRVQVMIPTGPNQSAGAGFSRPDGTG